MSKKALVTGGAGFIGSHLAKALLKRGIEVVILDDLSVGKIENVPEKARFIKGDVCSREDVTKAFDGVDIVFHEAARVSIRASMEGFNEDAETNLMGTLNILKCCADATVNKIVYASSMAVYADCRTPAPISEDYCQEPISPYGISKLASEKYCLLFSKQTGIDCHVLRYFNTYGMGQTFTPYVGVVTIFIRHLLLGKPPVIFGDGNQRRDFVHVNDIVSANLRSMDSQIPAGIFNIGSGVGRTINEIAQLLCQKINPEIQPFFMDAHPGELRYSIADIGSAIENLGYRPVEKLENRIDEIIHYHKTIHQKKNSD
jgi:UDP-glucose 4-epimerase